MKRILYFIIILLLSAIFAPESFSQCTFPGFSEDFGSVLTADCGTTTTPCNSYVVNHICKLRSPGGPINYPNDGEFGVWCNGDEAIFGWFGAGGTTMSDHTTDASGQTGNFLLVNSGTGPVEYYHRTISGLCANTTYTLSYSAGSVIRDGSYTNNPSLSAYIFPSGTAVSGAGAFSAAGGTLLGSTGSIPSETSANGFKWNAYSYNFTTGAGVTSIDIVLVSLLGNNAGCDFAIDDINVTGDIAGPEINVKAGAGSVASAGSFDFGSSNVGTATSATTFTIENLGSANLTLSGSPKVVISGTNAADFTIVQTGVSSPVAASGNTTFTITFTPSATGARTATISISNDDSDEGTYVVNLTGTGTAATPEINIKAATTTIASGNSFNFGSSNVGTATAATTFTIENLGTANLTLSGSPKVVISGTHASDFTIVQTGVSSPVAASGSTTFTITFNPSAAGTRTAAISISNDDSDEGTYVINLTGTGTAPEINVKAGAASVASAGSFDFGSSAVGTSTAATTFTIQNLGTANLTLSGTPKVVISGTNPTDFTIVQTGLSSPVAGSGSTAFTITFNPSATGARTAAISISNDDSDEGTYVINLTGTGIASCTFTGFNEDFGSVLTADCGTTTTPCNSYVVNHVCELRSPGGPGNAPNDGEFGVWCNGDEANVGWFGALGTTMSNHTINTSGQSGNFLLVNSDAGPVEYYHRTISGLCANTTYTLSYYAGNVVRDGVYANNPSLAAYIFPSGTAVSGVAAFSAAGGTLLGSSGSIPSETSANGFKWNAYSYNFTTGASQTSADIVLVSLNGNNAGYDFAIDDINIIVAIPGPEINVKAGAASVASAGSFDFGSSNVGTATSATTFTIENLGTTNLTLSGSPKVVISGTHAADFTIVQTGVTSPVAASGNTTFTITFNPSAAGARTAAISISNDDSDEGTYVVNLTGTGTTTTPEINVKAATTAIASGSNFDFGNSNVGTATAATTFTIENLGTANLTLSGSPKVAVSGTNASDFTIVQTGVSSSLAASGSTTFTITFNPSAAGTRTAAISISNDDSDEGTYVVNLKGTGTAATPEINVKAATTAIASGSNFDFGNSNVGTATAATTFTIENLGTANLTLSGSPKVVISGTHAADFTIVQTGLSSPVAASGITTFTITFNPSAAGTRTAAISISNDDSDEGTYVINLTGMGTAAVPEINIKAATTAIPSGNSFDFGSSNIGSATAATTFTIENLGTANLTLSGTPKVAISGTNAVDFIIVQTGLSSPVSISGTTTFTITFTPSATGARTAAISISNDDSDEGTYVINLAGTGTTCACSPLYEDFGTPPGGICSGVQGAANPYMVNHCNNCIGSPAINDGEYVISCDGTNLNAGWHGGMGSYIEDHTVSGQGGYFALLNADKGPREFYHRTITQLCPGAQYTLTFYAANVTKSLSSTDPTCNYSGRVNLTAYTFPAGTAVQAEVVGIGTFSAAGATRTLANTGDIGCTAASNAGGPGLVWTAYTSTFTAAAGENNLDLVLTSNLDGYTAGTDFVIDDITITKAGCTGSGTIGLPASQTITGPTTANANQTSVTYSVAAPPSGSTYSWSLPPGSVITSASSDSSSVTVTFGTTSGNVEVTETNSAGSTTNTLPVTINDATGISTGLGSDSYSNYPSPFSEETMLKINSSVNTPLSVKIINLKGNSVFESNEFYTNEDIKLGKGLASGVYMLQISYGSMIQVIKIVKL